MGETMAQPIREAVVQPRPDKRATDRARFVALAFCWGDILLEFDRHETIVFASGAVRPILARSERDLVGASLEDLVAAEDLGIFRTLLAVARRKGRIDNQFVRLKRDKGVTPPFCVSGYQMAELDDHYFFALRMGAKKISGLDEEHLSRTEDSGLYDADSFAELIEFQVRGGTLPTDSRMTMVNLPGLTSLQEKLDEAANENLMNAVGATLRANSIDGDTASLIGEDKYGLVHSADMDVAALEQRLFETSRDADPEGRGVAVATASIDMAEPAISGEDLAQGLIYSINKFKHTHGAHVDMQSLSTNLSDLVTEATDSVNGFKRVVSGREFDVAFHPIVDVHDGSIHHYEALVRFHSQEEGQSPYEYIVFAEETGLISDFDLAMAEAVVEWLAGQPKRFKVAVNISGNSVGNMAYVEGLQSLLRGNAWLHGRILFEITESARMTDLATANTFIQALRADGYEVCLDDFGAGAANFQYLSTLEVDVVKLDGSAVKNAQGARKGRAFLKALCNLCKELNVATIAEMVDSERSLEFVRDCGVDHAQGYLFGEPSTKIVEFEESLANRTVRDMFRAASR